MFVRRSSGPRIVTLDDGRILSVADLPDADTRWVASRKETVVLAVTAWADQPRRGAQAL